MPADVVLQVENLWKQYRLGLVGTGTIKDDLARFWAKLRGKEDPTLKIGEANDRQTIAGDYVWALQDINFEVKQGEVLGIIGKNGAGKSTLLKILSRVTQPTQGQIKMKGRVASLLEVGTGFHPELTGRENIFLNGAILGMSKSEIRSKFDEIVDFSGIGKYIDTPVKRYSSGMYVRLAFAVAAHLEPEILIIDEVLAVGDAEFQKKCLGKMKDVSGEGRTVLFVSHNMPAIRQMCQRAISLKNGRLLHDGTSYEVIDEYLQLSTGLEDGIVPENYDAAIHGRNGKLLIKKVHLVDEDGKPIKKILFRQTLKVLVEFDALEEVDDCYLQVCVKNLEGEFITYTATIDQNRFLSLKIPEGKHYITLNTSFELIPGSYILDTGFFTIRGHDTYDSIPEIYKFEVLHVASNEMMSYPWNNPFGYINTSGSWDLSPGLSWKNPQYV